MDKRKKRGRKPSRRNEDDEYIKTLCNQFEIMKKRLEIRKEKTLKAMNQVTESLLFRIHPDILNTQLKDLPEETPVNVTNQNGLEGTEETSTGSHGTIIDSGSKLSGVLCPRSPLEVATKLNTIKASKLNSLSKYMETPSSSSAGILRIPEPGEYAVSASGSPLLVSSSAADTVNINIPLKNGKKIAILSNAEVIPTAICDSLDPSVMSQLKQLTVTLSKIIEDI